MDREQGPTVGVADWAETISKSTTKIWFGNLPRFSELWGLSLSMIWTMSESLRRQLARWSNQIPRSSTSTEARSAGGRAIFLKRSWPRSNDWWVARWKNWVTSLARKHRVAPTWRECALHTVCTSKASNS